MLSGQQNTGFPPKDCGNDEQEKRLCGQTLFKILEHLHPLVEGVADVDPVLLVHIEPGREIESPGFRSRMAHIEKELTVFIEDLEVVECGIHHIDMPLGVDPYALRL